MYEPKFELESFQTLPFPAQCDMIASLTRALAGVNYAYLNANYARTPALYDSGVVYADPPKSGFLQPWRDIPRLLAIGSGTCMDLAAWRLAELWKQNCPAEPKVSSATRGNNVLFHVTIQDPNMNTEDPSQILGMGADQWSPFYR